MTSNFEHNLERMHLQHLSTSLDKTLLYITCKTFKHLYILCKFQDMIKT